MQYYYSVYPQSKDGSPLMRELQVANPEQLGQYFKARSTQGEEAAAALFPAEWKWLVPPVSDNAASDMPASVDSGIILSMRAFSLFHEMFPLDIQNAKTIQVGEQEFKWFFPKVHDRKAVLSGAVAPDIYLDRKTYKKFYSQRFVDLWMVSGFAGWDFHNVDLDAQVGPTR